MMVGFGWRGGWFPRRWAVALVALIMACAPPGRPGPNPTSEQASAAPAQSRVVASPRGNGAHKLGLAVPDRRVEPWLSLALGAQDEAARRGVELIIPEVGWASEAERQAQQIRGLLGRVDFIQLGGGEGPTVAPAIEEALAQGVPIGGLSSLVPVERVVFKIGPDRYGMGRLQAECLGAALPRRGEVGLLSGSLTSAPAVEQSRGFKETLRRQFPDAQLVVEQTGVLDRVAAAALVADWLQQWPGLQGLASGYEEGVLGIFDALADAGRLGRTKVAAADLGPLTEGSLRDGGLHCASVQQAVAEGRSAVSNALAYLAGEHYEKNLKSAPVLVTGENIGRLDWGPIRAPRD
jgi:ABC-type sugar transport system substrate-binding protein